MFQFSRMIFREDYEKLRKAYETKANSFELAAVVGAITQSKELIETAVAEKGAINMCAALEKLKEEGKREGQREIAYNLLKKGIAIDIVEEVTGVPREELFSLRSSLN